MIEQPFCDRTQGLLKARKVTSACDNSVKNGVMGAFWIMMTRENEELIIYEMHEKDWKLSTSKTAEAAILLDLIATLRIKSRNTNQGKVDVHIDNIEI